MNKEYIKFIQQLSFSFAKFHYDIYLDENQIQYIPEKDVESYVSKIYSTETKKQLFSFVRKSLKDSLIEYYNPLAVEPILQEINDNDSFARQRIVTEIHDFQKEFY